MLTKLSQLSGRKKRDAMTDDKEMKAFFAKIKDAYSKWPDLHHFQPVSAEHLRAWLLVQIGHCDLTFFNMSDFDDAGEMVLAVVYAALRVKNPIVETDPHGNAGIAVARSMKNISQEDKMRLIRNCSQILAAEIGE